MSYSSKLLDEFYELDPIFDLSTIIGPKFANIIIKSDSLSYTQIKKLIYKKSNIKIISFLNICNRFDLKELRYVIYDIIYIYKSASKITIKLCEDLLNEYKPLSLFYDKLIKNKYILKYDIKHSPFNLYTTCNNVIINDIKYKTTYYYAKYIVENNYDLYEASEQFKTIRCFYLNHKLHNEDIYYDNILKDYNIFPAIIEEGTHSWYANGKLHNDTRLKNEKGEFVLQPAIIYSDGSKDWFVNGKLHNDTRLLNEKGESILQPARINTSVDVLSQLIDDLHLDYSIGINAKEWYINGLEVDKYFTSP